MATKRWRRSFYKLVPSWLSTGDGEKVLYSIGRLTDGFIERARASLTARFPSYSGPTGLALIGKERGIVPGRTEDSAGYARRLIEWRGERGHLVRGSPFALLRQVWAYFGGMRCQTIDYNGNVFEVARDGTETVVHGATWNWSDDTRRPRFWVVIYPEPADGFGAQPDFGDPALWGGALGTAGYTVGQTGATIGDSRMFRGLFDSEHPWNPAGTLPEWLIISLDGSPPVPDGTWGTWSFNTGAVQVESRNQSMRYWSLSPTINNTYTGDPTNFPISSGMLDSASTSGDPDSFPAAASLPDGTTYAGNSARFPVAVQLLDDGDIPQ